MARNKYPEVTVNRILDASMKLFLEKGYDKTTIQDIVDELGDLSKGAIYHHFRSKEDILEAALNRSQENSAFELIKHLKADTGLGKLQELGGISVSSEEQLDFFRATPNILKNPRFLAMQLYDSINEVAPALEILIREGISDGSITADYPKELAEVLILLLNIWLNPMVFSDTPERTDAKYEFLKDMFEKLGIPLLNENFLTLLKNFHEFV